MISVTNSFKTKVKSATKEMRARLTDGTDTIYGTDDLKSIKITSTSSLCKTVMRQAEASYLDSHDYLDKYVNLAIGVVLEDSSVEYIDYGKFKVVELKTNKAFEGTTIKMYDKMYEALQAYDLDPIYDRTFPCTLKELVEAICTRFSWTLGSSTFPNDDTTISTDVFTGNGLTYRKVLDMVAEASGSIIFFDVNDQLKFKQVSLSTEVESLTANELLTMSVKPKYGEINSVVLSRMPQEDNIAEQDATSIGTNGLTELKFVNNYIVDTDRHTWITEIFSALNGLEFYPSEVTTIGLGYLQIGDRIIITDNASNSYETVITETTIDLSTGFTESIKSVQPDKTSTDYSTAGIIGQLIRNTEVIVNKQSGEITLLSSQITDNTTLITQLLETASGLELSVQSIGGTNLLRNSVGLKGTLEEWQVLDSEGDLTDARNAGTIVRDQGADSYSESKSGIRLDNQYITQTINTIIGETYTFYCRFKKNTTLNLILNGVVTEVTVDGYVNGEWAVFRYQWDAVSNSTSVKLETTSSYAIVSDCVAKLGAVAGWVQAPNEVYGTNYRFDQDGLQITSSSSSYRSLINSEKFEVRNTSEDKIRALFSAEEAKARDLQVYDSLEVRNYDPTLSYGCRIIPTTTGAQIILNE